MNPQQFAEWLNMQFKGGQGQISGLPTPIQMKWWNRVVDGMFPHYYGLIPQAIRDAFPNETAHQWQYRVNIHESMTEDQLWQAISDVKRLIMSDKFAIESESGIRTFINEKIFGHQRNQDFETFIFDSVYPRRVLDPNALLACMAVPNAEDLTRPVGIMLRMFPSKDIAWFEHDLVIVYDRKKSKKTGVETYLIFTPNYQLVHKKMEGNTWITEELYNHNSGNLCVTPLGGVQVTVFDRHEDQEVTYFKSDFSYAVGKMNTLERKNNQMEAATLRVVYPHMVTQGLQCHTCDGEGTVIIRDEQTGGITKPHHHDPDYYKNTRKIKGGSVGGDLLLNTYSDQFEDDHIHFQGDNPLYDELHPKKEICSSCGGSGKIALSVLDNITVTPPNNEIFDEDGNLRVSGNIADKVIGFASPPIDSVRELREQTKDAQMSVSEALNITKPSKFAESGVAKEKDRDGKKTKLQDISDGITTLAIQTLDSVASLRFLDMGTRQAEQEGIKIVQPQDFEIKPVEELEKEYFNNLENKPLQLRRKQFKELLLKRFKNDNMVNVLDDLAFMYTNGMNLLTQEELINMELAGLITKESAIKAVHVQPILEMLVKMNRINFEMPPMGDALDALIDPFMQPLIESVQNAGAMTPTMQIQQMDEDDDDMQDDGAPQQDA